MIKSYTTQLQHVFHMIGKQDEAIADSARLLAQALVGEGKIYVLANKRFSALADTIVQNDDTLQGIERMTWQQTDEVSTADRMLVLSDGAETEDEASRLQSLLQTHIPLAFLGPGYPNLSFVEGIEEPIAIITQSSPIVPAADGSKCGYPTEIAIIYAYQAMMFELSEMTVD
ncbi:DUF2529 family protein [Salicibibacter halophilus]|uniref:DUF2529 family protein n=1 Tax=Salicibibacter halophilus TaxID=2502791 RepID=A0A514LIS5_9BACI|nr:DUF2529 family protein [Salicibibacter halophilus]QDI91743.1 DUF2529 family protein [Salicibibacter halophilus]